MSKLLLVVPLFAICFAMSVSGQDKDKPLVGALAPHKLDGAFRKANTEEQIVKALLNDPLFKKAVKEALKAKKDNEAAKRQNPKLIGSMPEQAARVAFLKTLEDKREEGEGGIGATPPKK